MDIEYLHLYVKDAAVWRDWFVEKLKFQPVPQAVVGHLGELAVQSARIQILISSEQSRHPEVQGFLRQYAQGVGDVALRVRNLEAIAARVQATGGQVTQPIRQQVGPAAAFRWCRIRGWGGIHHTLIEHSSAGTSPGTLFQPVSDLGNPEADAIPRQGSDRPLAGETDGGDRLPWVSIDHAVLNVPSGQLAAAVRWYEETLGFVRQQSFAIATTQSGLRSFVLKHPEGTATLPINEPTSQNSQIQEFLDVHGGAGIQHVALRTGDLVQTVAHLRQRGVAFLSVPATYYEQLRQRPGFWQEAGDWTAIAQQQILVDWPADTPQTRLLQTFTHPLFEEPTFFWEFIERQSQVTTAGMQRAEGFGEGNFQALFEAIEREQKLRGSL